MRFDYTQIFLILWIILFWVYHFASYGKVEGQHEKSMKEKYGGSAIWQSLFGLSFIAWTAIILIYFFHYNSINWIYRLSFIDYVPVKILAIMLMCFAFLLYFLFTISVGKSIKSGLTSGDKPLLVSTGIYKYSRHPAYLAFLIFSIGIFFIIPNVITLALLIYTCVATYGHTLGEEKKLILLYGEDYKQYQNNVGRFFSKIF